MVGHDDCQGVNDRFHLVSCDKYLAKRPRFPTLFYDKWVPDWRDRWQSHFNLGLGIPYEHTYNDGVVTVCGNPFQQTVTQLINGTLSLFHLGSDDRCKRCLLKSCDNGDRCKIPVKFIGGSGLKVALQWWPDNGPCGKCGSHAKKLSVHLGRRPNCAMHYFGPFWDKIIDSWEHASVTDRNTTTFQWWLDQPGTCVCDWDLPCVIGTHLRLRTGTRCLERIATMFEEWIGDGGRPVQAGLNTSWKRG